MPKGWLRGPQVFRSQEVEINTKYTLIQMISAQNFMRACVYSSLDRKNPKNMVLCLKKCPAVRIYNVLDKDIQGGNINLRISETLNNRTLYHWIGLDAVIESKYIPEVSVDYLSRLFPNFLDYLGWSIDNGR